MNKLKLSIALAIICAVLFANGQNSQTHAKTFSIDLFEQNLKTRLEGRTIGYTYAIYERETLRKRGAGGHWLLPDQEMYPDRRLTALSMSKTITAAAVMKAIEELRSQGKTISIDSPVAPYIPRGWVMGPNVQNITFKHLLTHTSGLWGVGSKPDSYASLQKTIAQGTIDNPSTVEKIEEFGKKDYENANFCLFRIIIPYMIYPEQVDNLTPETAPLETGKLYVKYVREKIFAPIALGDVDVYQPGPGLNRYYVFNDLADFSEDRPTTDLIPILHAGAGFWRLSSVEFGRFISKLRYGKIVSPESFQSMMENELGMYESASLYGKYYNHNGGTEDAQADWMIFPNGITAVFQANSGGGLATSPQALVRIAYNDAWTE